MPVASAVMLASMFKAKVLLGTATPGVETYFNASSGKYGLVELKERYKDIRLPHIELVDIKELAHQKRMQGPFSPALVKQMKKRHWSVRSRLSCFRTVAVSLR